MGAKNAPLAVRLKRKSRATAKGCRVWLGFTVPKGYGRIWNDDRKTMMSTHRAAYVLAYGAVPKGCELHHTCENKRCINPAHIVAMPRAQHERLHLKPTCIEGHAYTAKNTRYRANGARYCIQCNREYQLAWYHANKGV
jgi:hypothetical protein